MTLATEGGQCRECGHPLCFRSLVVYFQFVEVKNKILRESMFLRRLLHANALGLERYRFIV